MPSDECEPSPQDDEISLASTSEDDPSADLEKELAALGRPPVNAHETQALEEQADLRPDHEETPAHHQTQCDLQDISIKTVLEVRNLSTEEVNRFGSFPELQCPWCPEGGSCAVRIRRWMPRWALSKETNVFIEVPTLTCEVHKRDFSVFTPVFWKQLMHLCQENKARVFPGLVPISSKLLLTTLAYQCAPHRHALKPAFCAVSFQ
jgi:hypothetical protein